ncbi:MULTISPECIES: hypothetical protein [unclassified Brevundimonas]|uniref:hypothetical protein n=1 Tax=unclassified Brevundimonas TaxID=2622653 RepID=UPI003F928137
MSLRAFLIAVALWLAAVSPVMAEAMTVQQFMTIADRIPHNPLAILRPDTHQLIGEVKQAVLTVKAEQASAIQAGRRPATCIPPSGTGITAQTLMARFNSLPASRRQDSITQAVRDWMAERYPCPG